MPRKPNLDPTKKPHRSNEQLKKREDETPIYLKQEFKPPKSLTKEEKKIWKWLVGIFHETVNCRVSDADVHLMELYCRAKAATDEADAELKKEGAQPFEQYQCGYDDDGRPKYQLKANPNIKKRADNAALCIKLFDQLGLSPLARAKAGLASANQKKKTKDSLLNMMKRTDE